MKQQWMKQIFFFAVQVLEENMTFIFSEYLKETINGILNGGNTLRERILKIYLPVTYIILNINL